MKLKEGGRTAPDQTGKIGRVVIKYRPGCNGPVSVQCMSQFGFDRLNELVGVFAELVKVRAELAARPERKVREQAAKMLGLKAPKPIEQTKPDPYEFNVYAVNGFVKKCAVLTGRKVKLIPLNIVEVKFVDVTNVEN